MIIFFFVRSISIGGIFAGLLFFASLGYIVDYKNIKAYNEWEEGIMAAFEAQHMLSMEYYDSRWYYSHGVNAFEKGNYDRALKAFNKALEVYPYTGYLELSAAASYCLGDFDTAVRNWETVVKAVPDYALHRQNLENAKKAREQPSFKPAVTIEPKQE